MRAAYAANKCVQNKSKFHRREHPRDGEEPPFYFTLCFLQKGAYWARTGKTEVLGSLLRLPRGQASRHRRHNKARPKIAVAVSTTLAPEAVLR